MRALLLLTMLMLLPLQMNAATNVLENNTLRLEVSPDNGSIVHLLDKRTHTDYINDQKQAKLFRLLLPLPNYLARHVDSREQKADSVSIEDGTLKIHYPKLQISRQKYIFQVGVVSVPEPEYDIDVTVTFRLDNEHILGRLQVTNHSLEEITDVIFPWLGGLAGTLEGRHARVVLPSLSQKALATTADFILSEHAKTYPALLATSWMNYEFEHQGIGVEARSSPETQDAILCLSPGVFSGSSAYLGPSGNPYIGWNFYPHIPGQSQWTSPEVVIHVHVSDWHSIASEHREWYRQRFSPPYSHAFEHAIGFATYRLKRGDNTVNWTYDEIPRLAREARAAGIHDLVIDGWREREGPGNPAPFGEFADPRLGGGSRLEAQIEKLHEQGTELLLAVRPTLVNTAAEQYKMAVLRWTVKSRRQGNQLSPAYTYISADYPYEDYAAHYLAQIDPATAATDYLLQEARRWKEDYGFRNLFLRGVGLQSLLSYNHDDPVPPQKAYEAGYARYLGGLKELYPQGMLMMEGLNDLVNPYSSAGYTWSQMEGAEILALSIPWVPFSNDVEALDYDQANASFARKILINLIVDGGDGSVGRYVEFARHLKALQALKEATVPYYASAEFRDHEHLKSLQAPSNVVVAVFENRTSKQLGLTLSNLSDQERNVSLELDLPNLPAKGHLFRLAGQREEIGLSPRVSVALGPREVAILGIDPEP